QRPVPRGEGQPGGVPGVQSGYVDAYQYECGRLAGGRAPADTGSAGRRGPHVPVPRRYRARPAEWRHVREVSVHIGHTAGSDAGAAGQAFGVEDDDALAVQAQPAAGGEVGERLVDGLPGGADELGHLLLGEVVGHPEYAAVAAAELAGHVQQVLGDPAGNVGEDEVGELVVGAPQPPGEYPQQLLGDLGPVGQPGAQGLLAQPGQPYVGDRGRGGRTRPGIEDGQLPDGVGGAHDRDQVLPAVGRAATELDLAGQHDVQAVAGLAFVEDHFA